MEVDQAKMGDHGTGHQVELTAERERTEQSRGGSFREPQVVSSTGWCLGKTGDGVSSPQARMGILFQISNSGRPRPA